MPIERLYDIATPDAVERDLYCDLQFPEAPVDRPYTYVNMVATVDGKILIGPRGSTAKGLGGPGDQLLMKRLQSAAEGAIIGAGTLRAGMTRSGDIPLDNRFFSDAPDRAIIFVPKSLPGRMQTELRSHGHLRVAGRERVDLKAALKVLRGEFEIKRLLLEGGADLNSEFFLNGFADEFFLTVAPKIKGGAHLPSPVGGPGFPDRSFQPMSLLSIYRDGDELYLRYRVEGPPTSPLESASIQKEQ